MKNITTILSEEHQIILNVIEVMFEECEHMKNGEVIDHNFFRNVIYFIKNYADGFHHIKEEDILFKVILDKAAKMHCDPIPVMLHEHEEGRRYVKGMEDALYRNNVHKLTENASGYGHLLQSHIYKEDNMLYPMAEEALSDIQKKQVEELCNKININVFFNNSINNFLEILYQRQVK